jgi:O-antigen/teichoic acid export membrane protein
MVYLTHGGFWLISGQVLTTAANFFISVGFAYFLPKSVYGDYRYVLSIFAVLSAFSLTGLNTAIIQSVARGFEGSLRQGFRLAMRWSGLMVAGALAGSAYYFTHGNMFLGFSLLIISLAAPLMNSWGLFVGFINGKKDFKRLSIYTVIDNVVPALLVFGAIFLTDRVIYLVLVYFAANTLMGYVLYERTLSAFRPGAAADPELESYSKKLSVLNVIGIVAANIDKVIVYSFLGSVELAVYGFATAFPDQIRNVLKNLNTLMVPKFTERSAAGEALSLRRKALQLLALVVAITLGYIILAPFLYSIFFPKYPESVFFSRLLALMILSSLAMIPSSVFVAQKKEKELAKYTIIGSLFQILALVPAAYLWGLFGVCLARIAASYINVGIAYFMLRAEMRNPARAPE